MVQIVGFFALCVLFGIIYGVIVSTVTGSTTIGFVGMIFGFFFIFAVAIAVAVRRQDILKKRKEVGT